MIFTTTDEMAKKLFKQTADIAGRIAASGEGNTSPTHAAKMARHVMTELLGLKSMKFELTQTAFVVNSVEVTIEVKDEYASRGYPDDFGPKTPKPTAQAGRPMASVADGEAREVGTYTVEDRPKMVGHYPVELDGSTVRAPTTSETLDRVVTALNSRMEEDPEFDAAAREAIDASELDGSTERAADDPTYLGKARLGRVTTGGGSPATLDDGETSADFTRRLRPEGDGRQPGDHV